MATSGIRKRVSRRTGRVSYQVWWRMEDGSQGARTVSSRDEARELLDEKRLEMRRGTWRGRRRGRLPFNHWADEWWSDWSADPHRSPNTLVMAESRLRNHVRPFFDDRPLERIGPADVRRWQAQLDGRVGYDTLTQCRSLVRRILEYATDEGAIEANPVRKVPPPKRRADPEMVFAEMKRRALTPDEAGRLLACFPLFWWDHVTTLLGTGLRFGELAGLRRRRVHLNRSVPILEVGPTRYQAGRFGSGFKPRPKSDASIRPVPLAPLVVEAVRRQLPSGSDPEALVFTGPQAAARRLAEAPAPSSHATTSGAPTRQPSASSPIQSPSYDRPPYGPSERCGWTTVRRPSTSPPGSPRRAVPSDWPRSSVRSKSSLQPGWSLRPVTRKRLAGRRFQPYVTRS